MTMPDTVTATQITYEVFLKHKPGLRKRCTNGEQTRSRVEPRMKDLLARETPILQQNWRVHSQNVDWDLLAYMAQNPS